jgi:ABC-type sugar transport system substrate-binding protein
MVKLSTAALFLALASTADAFKPTAFVPKKVATPTISNDWRPGMKMVAGGAEKAYGEEYYEGKLVT